MNTRLAALVIGALLAGCAMQPRTTNQSCGSLPHSFTPPIVCPLADKDTTPLAGDGGPAYDSSSEDHK